LTHIGRELDYEIAMGMQAEIEEEMDQEKRQANYMGENPLPDSQLEMCSDMGEDPKASTSSSSTQYSMTLNVTHDAGDMPAPAKPPPKLPFGPMLPPPTKKAPPILAAHLVPKDGKYPGKQPQMKTMPPKTKVHYF